MAMQRVTVKTIMSLLAGFWKENVTGVCWSRHSNIPLILVFVVIGNTHPPTDTHLFNFGAFVPGAHLLAGGQAVHGHQADGEGQCAHDDFPRVGGHQQAVKPKQASQHGAPGRLA